MRSFRCGVRACVRAYRAVPCRAARGRAQGRLPQALADVFVKGEWSPQVAIQKALHCSAACHGVGAQAMACGSMRAPTMVVGWPTSEFGGMGLEGAIKLGYRKAITT